MKYIRTKDGRIRELDFDYRTGAFTGNGYYRYKATPTEQANLVHKNFVVKQADTIEELCDRCIIIKREDGFPIILTFYEAKEYIDNWKRKIESNNPIIAIYGAIWTGKGLIYVAKMNDKGELELI